MEVALFNELASTPATLDASRVADMYACFEDHAVESRDVEQAYLQAEMEGPPVYVVLPEELWTPEMWEIHRRGDTPVARLKRRFMVTRILACIGRDFATPNAWPRDSNQLAKIGPVFTSTTRPICCWWSTWTTGPKRHMESAGKTWDRA